MAHTIQENRFIRYKNVKYQRKYITQYGANRTYGKERVDHPSSLK